MYYQNLFNQDFVAALLISDRQYNISFKIKANTNSSIEIYSWNKGPYNLTGNTNLYFNYSFDSGKTFTSLAINAASGAASLAAVTATEVINNLLANPTFAALFNASIKYDEKRQQYIYLVAKQKRENWKLWISNVQAETIIRFNAKALVGELPSYFSRHTIANINNFPDSTGSLLLLDPSIPADAAIITNAGFDPLTVKADWQLLAGRVGLIEFKSFVIDGSDRITQQISYSAGAKVGDLSIKTSYFYTGANKSPDKVCSIIYTLTSADLVTP